MKIKHSGSLKFYILIMLSLVAFFVFPREVVKATELKNTITDVVVWDNGNDREATKKDNVYQIELGRDYKYEVKFDLSNYDGKLKDGDYFSFSVPEPLLLINKNFDLVDDATKLVIGSAEAISNGPKKGGKVTITLKNLSEYIKAKGGEDVRGVKGTFYVGFNTSELTETITYNFPVNETTKDISHQIKVVPKPKQDYSALQKLENLAKYSGVLQELKWSSDILGKKGDFLHSWVVRVNNRHKEINQLVVKDFIDDSSAPIQYIPETLVVRAGHYTPQAVFVPSKTLVSGTDYTFEFNPAYNKLDIRIPNASSHKDNNGDPATFEITYNTTSPGNGTDVVNGAEVYHEGELQTITTTTTATSTVVKRTSKVVSGGTIQLETGYKITLYKVDSETNERLSGAVFTISPPEGAAVSAEDITTNEDGVAQSQVYSESDVAKGEFIITEKTPPKGYQQLLEPIKVTVGKEGVVRTIKNSRIPTSAVITVNKLLEGKKLKGDDFTFVLKKENGEMIQKVNNNADGVITFSPLSFTQEGTYRYKITEESEGADHRGVTYDKDSIDVIIQVISGDNGQLSSTVSYSKNGLANQKTFNNTYKASATTATLSATKVLAGRSLSEGEFEFELKKDDQLIETVTNKKDGSVTFSPVSFDTVGKYTYTISEKVGSLSGVSYDDLIVTATVTVEDDGQGHLIAKVAYSDDVEFNNTYKASGATATLSATKVLTGRSLSEGEFEFELKKDDQLIETVTNKKDGSVTFSPVSFDTVGKYTYTISEKVGSLSGVSYDDLIVTATVTVEDDGQGHLIAKVAYSDDVEFNNTYKASGATATLSVTKVLEGRALAANEFEFELKEGDTLLQTKSNAQNGLVAFDAIAYSEAGTHTYTITEKAGNLPNVTYSTTPVKAIVVVTDKGGKLEAVVTYEGGNQTITNTYVAPVTELTITKVWDDADNQDGKRPAEVEAALLANGKEVKRVVLSATNNWTETVKGLPTEENGVVLVYTVSEKTTLDGYTTVITGEKEQGFVITNSRKPETIAVKATKEWDDANNQDGKRPEKITVNLLADGAKIKSEDVQADAQGKWEVNFENLPKYKAGQEIKYTVTEETVAEYTTDIKDFNIVNKYLPKQIEYKVTKVWDDADNQDGKRPESITVQLYKSVKGGDTVAVDGQTLTLSAANKVDDNTWSASFMNLPQFEAGQEVTYSVQEVNVPEGYTADVKGQQITNSYTPETVVLTGSKVWNDMNNQDGKRVNTVTVEILQGDVVVDTIQVSEATGWAFTSKPLPKYNDGQVITYTVREVAVAHYTTEVISKDGKYTITNTHAPEKVIVSGTKTWNDANNYDGKRPESITVALLADGVATGQTVVVTGGAKERWVYNFGELDRYKDGKEIIYSVKELNVPDGYQSEATGMNLVNSRPVSRIPGDYPTVDLPEAKLPTPKDSPNKPTPKDSPNKPEPKIILKQLNLRIMK